MRNTREDVLGVLVIIGLLIGCVLGLMYLFSGHSPSTEDMRLRTIHEHILPVTLPDSTRCVVLYGWHQEPASISCAWQGERP